VVPFFVRTAKKLDVKNFLMYNVCIIVQICKRKSMNTSIEKIKAIADPLRIRILRALDSFEWLYVCELLEGLDAPFYTISRQLKELRQSGLVSKYREGRFIRYSLSLPQDAFHQHLREIVLAVEDNIFAEDKARLEKSVSKRAERTTCTVCETSYKRGRIDI